MKSISELKNQASEKSKVRKESLIRAIEDAVMEEMVNGGTVARVIASEADYYLVREELKQAGFSAEFNPTTKTRDSSISIFWMADNK